MAAAVRLAFERELIIARLDQILPLRQVTDRVKATVKYRRIAQSIAEIGVIEPLAVARSADTGGLMLLDGHIRHAILNAERAVESADPVSVGRAHETLSAAAQKLAEGIYAAFQQNPELAAQAAALGPGEGGEDAGT